MKCAICSPSFCDFTSSECAARRTFQLPGDPVALSFMASCVLPVDYRSKQALLEFSDTALRLGTVRDVLEIEVERLLREPEPKGAAWSPITSELLARYRCNN